MTLPDSRRPSALPAGSPGQEFQDLLNSGVGWRMEPAGRAVLDHARMSNLDLFALLDSGHRPIDFILEHAMPGHTPLEPALHRNLMTRLDLDDWTVRIRDLGRLARTVLEHDPADPAVMRARAVMWAQAFHAGEKWAVLAQRTNNAPGITGSPAWFGTLRKFDRDLARALGWQGMKGQTLSDHAHAASLKALLGQEAAGVSHARLAMEATLAHHWTSSQGIHGPETSWTSQDSPRALLEIAHRLAPILEPCLPGPVQPDLSPWAAAWKQYTLAYHESTRKSPARASALLCDHRLWYLALPALAHAHRQMPPGTGVETLGQELLAAAMERDNPWPPSSSWSAVLEQWGWSEAIRRTALERRLEQSVPQALQARGNTPRL